MVHVVHNGIDTDLYRPVPETDVLVRLGVDLDRPIVSFVGRITRQKGVPHLLRAALDVDRRAQLLLLAGAADTPELAAEIDAAVADLRAARDGVFLVDEHLPPADVRQVLSHSTVFVCPSVYEPLGIVNLEAMACGTAVVASDVGGIPEVVGRRRDRPARPLRPGRPGGFEAALAEAVNRLVADPSLAAAMGAAGRAPGRAGLRLGRRRPLDRRRLRHRQEPIMKLATIRLDGGHRAVRIDGDTATVLDASDVGALLADPGGRRRRHGDGPVDAGGRARLRPARSRAPTRSSASV